MASPDQIEIGKLRNQLTRLNGEAKLLHITISELGTDRDALRAEVGRLNKKIGDIKKEAVTKAAEVVESVLATDLDTICKQLGIEPAGEATMPASLRIAATLKVMADQLATQRNACKEAPAS